MLEKINYKKIQTQPKPAAQWGLQQVELLPLFGLLFLEKEGAAGHRETWMCFPSGQAEQCDAPAVPGLVAPDPEPTGCVPMVGTICTPGAKNQQGWR